MLVATLRSPGAQHVRPLLAPLPCPIIAAQRSFTTGHFGGSCKQCRNCDARSHSVPYDDCWTAMQHRLCHVIACSRSSRHCTFARGALEEHHTHATSPASMTLTPALLPHVSSAASLMQQLQSTGPGAREIATNFCMPLIIEIFSKWQGFPDSRASGTRQTSTAFFTPSHMSRPARAFEVPAPSFSLRLLGEDRSTGNPSLKD